MNSTAWIIRVYKLLLKLYPIQFRSEYESEMATVFALHMRDKADEGWASYSIACLQNIFDLICNLFPEYLATWGKEFPMKEITLSTKLQNHLALWGCLCFGGLAIIRPLFSDVVYSPSELSKFPLFASIIQFLAGLIFTGTATGLFWMGISHKKGKWNFFYPVLASEVVFILLVWISKNTSYTQPASNWITMYSWSFFRVVLRGITFGSFFGWVYQGRKDILRFAFICGIAEAFGFIVWQIYNSNLGYIVYESSILLGVSSFNIHLDTWYLFCNNLMNVVWWLIFGALIGWEIDRRNPRKTFTVTPDLS